MSGIFWAKFSNHNPNDRAKCKKEKKKQCIIRVTEEKPLGRVPKLFISRFIYEGILFVRRCICAYVRVCVCGRVIYEDSGYRWFNRIFTRGSECTFTRSFTVRLVRRAHSWCNDYSLPFHSWMLSHSLNQIDLCWHFLMINFPLLICTLLKKKLWNHSMHEFLTRLVLGQQNSQCSLHVRNVSQKYFKLLIPTKYQFAIRPSELNRNTPFCEFIWIIISSLFVFARLIAKRANHFHHKVVFWLQTTCKEVTRVSFFSIIFPLAASLACRTDVLFFPPLKLLFTSIFIEILSKRRKNVSILLSLVHKNCDLFLSPLFQPRRLIPNWWSALSKFPSVCVLAKWRIMCNRTRNLHKILK